MRTRNEQNGGKDDQQRRQQIYYYFYALKSFHGCISSRVNSPLFIISYFVDKVNAFYSKRFSLFWKFLLKNEKRCDIMLQVAMMKLPCLISCSTERSASAESGRAARYGRFPSELVLWSGGTVVSAGHGTHRYWRTKCWLCFCRAWIWVVPRYALASRPMLCGMGCYFFARLPATKSSI